MVLIILFQFLRYIIGLYTCARKCVFLYRLKLSEIIENYYRDIMASLVNQ